MTLMLRQAGYNALAENLILYFNPQYSTPMGTGTSLKENEARRAGWLDGIAQALANQVNQIRADRYLDRVRQDFLPAVAGSDVRKALADYKQQYEDAVSPKNKGDLIDVAYGALVDLATSEAIDQHVIEYRRERLLKGEIPKDQITGQDVRWIKEYLSEHESTVGKLRSLIS
jgi:hypothetical protein